MVIKKDSNQFWTFVGIAVVVAVIASILTVTVTGNMIKQNNNPWGKYKVYTVDEIDAKLNSLSKNVDGVYSHCYEKGASTKGWGEIGLYTYDNNTFVNSVNVACGINEKVLPKSATCNPKTWAQKTPIYVSSISKFDKSKVLNSKEGEGLTLMCIGGESQGILSVVCCSAPGGTTTCVERWSCSSWNVCSNGKQTRDCQDLNSCGTTKSKPLTTQSCCTLNSDCDKGFVCNTKTGKCEH